MQQTRSTQQLVAASVVFSLFISFSPEGVYAAEHLVPSEFATIQAAISAPTFSSGDAVVVAPGTYSGHITVPININLTIRGTETARTFLEGDNSGLPVITIDGREATVPSIVNIQKFTFVNASSGISISNNTTLLNLSNVITVNVTNNVFQDLAGTAITESASRAATVANNTFNHNVTALSCDSDIVISNNIFSRNNIAISDIWTSAITNITNNAFFGNSQDVVSGATVTTGTNPVLETTQNPTPLFVDPLNADPLKRDFHLQEGSLCIGSGNNSGTPTDVGAYGGTSADTIPFPVSGLTITSATGTSIDLSWLPNNSYLVTNTTSTLAGGYNLYVGPAPGSYTGALTSSGTISSPINVGLVTSYTVTGLIALTTPLSAPDTVQSSPRDSGLVLTWTAVPGATGYEVHYGISSPDENVIDTQSAATSWELTGLTNGQHYLIAVKAYAQQQYFFNVTAYDNQFNNSASTPLHESAKLVANEKSIQIGQKQFSALSTVISDFPEALVTYPALPNTGGRCFIATAAYGYYSAPEVQALRAFRDRYLLTSAPGRTFVEWYYQHGPAAAEFLNDHPGYKPLVRAALMPSVGAAIFLTGTSTMFKAIVFLVFATVIAFGFFRKRPAVTGGLR